MLFLLNCNILSCPFWRSKSWNQWLHRIQSGPLWIEKWSCSTLNKNYSSIGCWMSLYIFKTISKMYFKSHRTFFKVDCVFYSFRFIPTSIRKSRLPKYSFPQYLQLSHHQHPPSEWYNVYNWCTYNDTSLSAKFHSLY